MQMTDEEFLALKKKYHDELNRREEKEKLVREKQQYSEILEKIKTAHNNPFESLSVCLAVRISLSDCEGRREIDRDEFQLALTYEQVSAFITDKIKSIDAKIDISNKENQE